MAKDKKIRMPMSTGGITRFSGEYKSGFEYKPEIVIFCVVLIIILMVLLHMQGGAYLGA